MKKNDKEEIKDKVQKDGRGVKEKEDEGER